MYPISYSLNFYSIINALKICVRLTKKMEILKLYEIRKG